MSEGRGSRRARGFALTVLLLLVGAAAGAFAAGRIAVGTPDSQLPDPQVLTAKVTDAVQVEAVSLAVTAEPARTIIVPARGGAVLTTVDVTPGHATQPCARLGSVNDEPLVALPGGTQLFRDLAKGDRGADVARLQEALAQCGHPAADESGTFGIGTQAAVRSLTGGSSLRAANVVWLAPNIGDVTVARWGADEGGALPAESPVLELRSDRVRVVATLDDPDEDRITVGDRAKVTDAEGRTGTAEVTAITTAPAPAGDPGDDAGPMASEGDPSGTSRSIVLSSATVSRPVTATWEVARSPRDSLSVPIAALNDCGGTGSCVTVVEGEQRRTVKVTVLVAGETGVAVAPAPEDALSVGDAVLLSTP